MRSFTQVTSEIIFEAADGKQFRHQSDCERYESQQVADKRFCFNATIQKIKYAFYKVSEYEELRTLALYTDRRHFLCDKFQREVEDMWKEDFQPGIYAFGYAETEDYDDIIHVHNEHSLMNMIDNLVTELIDFKMSLENQITSYTKGDHNI